MKNILLVSLVMLLAVSVAFSQFGIKGGINLGTVGGDDKSISTPDGKIDPKTSLGLVGGISYKLGLIMGLSIQPEVLYIQKGAIYEISGTMGNYYMNQKVTFAFNYIDIPILAKYNLPIPLLSPYIEGGVAYSVLLSAKEKEEMTTNFPGETSRTIETDIKDQYTKSDFSIIIGVGVEFLMLDVNARYVIGQTKLGKDDPTTLINEGDLKVYNRGFLLTAGIRF
ncbi:MAG: porin family protein [Ignavibacteriales bacterium]|nr:porin family protein [Ignavibacteriales bacterium]